MSHILSFQKVIFDFNDNLTCYKLDSFLYKLNYVKQFSCSVEGVKKVHILSWWHAVCFTSYYLTFLTSYSQWRLFLPGHILILHAWNCWNFHPAPGQYHQLESIMLKILHFMEDWKTRSNGGHQRMTNCWCIMYWNDSNSHSVCPSPASLLYQPSILVFISDTCAHVLMSWINWSQHLT